MTNSSVARWLLRSIFRIINVFSFPISSARELMNVVRWKRLRGVVFSLGILTFSPLTLLAKGRLESVHVGLGSQHAFKVGRWLPVEVVVAEASSKASVTVTAPDPSGSPVRVELTPDLPAPGRF